MPDNETVVEPPVVETPAEVVAAPAEWDGNHESLDTQEWWKAVPEKAREHFSKWHNDLTDTRAKHEYLDKLLQSDDAIATVLKERDGLKASLSDMTKQFESYKVRNTQLEQQLSEYESDREFDALAKKYPDIFDEAHFVPGEGDKPASGPLMTFIRMRNAGFSDDEAAKFARVDVPKKAEPVVEAKPSVVEPPKERVVEPPKSVRAATKPGANPSATTPAVADDWNAAVKKIEAEERAAGRV